VTALLVAIALALAAAGLSRVQRIGLERDLLITALRAIVQLTVVGLVVTVVFEHVGLAALFVLVMLGAAAWTSGRRLRGIDHGIARAGAAIATGAASGLVPLLASGGFDTTPRELIPVAGILIGGAMAATSVTGRRVLDDVGDQMAEIETRLLLGVTARTALGPVVVRGVRTGLISVLDQTKNVGLVTLPGTFVGLVLGGADPAEAARVQLVVLLSLLAVELVAALVCARLVTAACTRPGERVVAPSVLPSAAAARRTVRRR
jgi:putative ABC transport system permease protein